MEINWPLLVESGRAKAFGIPWSEDELKAIHEYKIPPEYVRGGCLNVIQYQAAISPSAGAKPDKFKKLDELRREADSLGVKYGKDTTRAELIELIREVNESSGNPLPPPEAASRK
jgi:hypothetical protein